MTDQEQQVVLLEHRSDMATLSMTTSLTTWSGQRCWDRCFDMIEQRYRMGRGRW